MKKFILSHGLLAVITAVAFTSCNDNDDVIPETGKTIVELVVETNEFSILEAAVVRAGLVETLSADGPFTVFAPTNDAFRAAGFADEASLQAVPVETLQSILLYHVLASSATASSIPSATNTEIETVGGSDVYVTKSNAGVFVNGGKVTQADVMATNGVIHGIDKVLMPPMGDVVETLAGNSDFSLLVAAVVRASQGTVNVKEALEGDGPLSVFAPTNQAFMDAGFATAEAIQAADPATLTSILTYHVVAGQVFSNSLTDGMNAATVNGGDLTFSLGGGAAVKGSGNATASKITGADMVVDNGVIHIIDQVLLP